MDEHLKCSATLPLYITSENAVSWTNFPRICYLNFLKFTFFGFPWCSTREDLSIDVSITNVGLILKKGMVISFLGVRTDRQTRFWSRFYGNIGTQNFSKKTFLKNKIKFLGSHAVVLVNTFQLMYQLLMQDWYWRSYGDFFSRGTDRWTDRQTGFWNPHMETCRHTKNFNSKLKISG